MKIRQWLGVGLASLVIMTVPTTAGALPKPPAPSPTPPGAALVGSSDNTLTLSGPPKQKGNTKAPSGAAIVLVLHGTCTVHNSVYTWYNGGLELNTGIACNFTPVFETELWYGYTSLFGGLYGTVPGQGDDNHYPGYVGTSDNLPGGPYGHRYVRECVSVYDNWGGQAVGCWYVGGPF